MKTPRILALSIASFLLAPSLHAVERFWIDPLGGTFADIANWSVSDGGVGGASVPVAGDNANFTLNNTYTVTFGAAVTLNALDGENGNVTLDLGGFTHTLMSGNASFIGQVAGQTGRLTLTDGTLAVDTTGDNVNVGNFAGSTGFLTISTGGILGTAALRPDLTVGNNGTGALTVNDNGRIDGAALNVGNGAGVTGTATITGPNAVGDFSSATTIGNGGAGTLSVLNGGTLASALTAVLGDDLGADGTATVSGIGSSWTIGANTAIGSTGDGTLTISGGGLVSSAGSVTLGTLGTGVGTATVTGAGSRWNLSATQSIGNSGLGVMTVASGGEVVSSTTASLGSNGGGEGRVTITGAGARWTLGSTLTVGNSGTGDLTISAGGEVSATSVTLGLNAAGTGVATITGAGSKLTTSGAVTVANAGTGTLNVANGAEVNVGTNLAVNDPAAAPVGTLNLDGGSIFVTGAFTNNGVFTFTDGLLQVKGNFQPSAAAGVLTINGGDNSDLPTLDLFGTGTTTNITTLQIGDSRRGQLVLRQGRVLNLGANTVGIGASAGGEGTISVQSGAQLLTTTFLGVGGSGTAVGGKGTLDLSGGTVSVGTLRLFRDGAINLNSGTLAVNSFIELDGQFNWTGGTLRFDAAFSLTSANVPKLLGLDATLDAGQALTSTAAVTLQTPVIVNGGALNASTLINQSRLEVRSGSIGAVQNNGLLFGDGTISGAVTNNAAGRIRVDAGKTLFFTGTFSPNAGELNLQGGTLDFAGAVTNSAGAFIAGRGALYTGGLTNNGQMAFSGGTMDIHGDTTFAAGSRIVTSGAGSVTTFFDDVVHNGTEIRTSAGCSTVFFGSVSGAGPYTGTGTVYFEGDLRPGNSPALVRYGGDVALGSASILSLEIGGLLAGSQYDRLNVAGTLFEDGVLDVSLYNGFAPVFGDSFDLFDATEINGSFDAVNLPALTGGLEWDATNLQSTGQLRVVPEPGVATLVLAGLSLLGVRRRKHHAAISPTDR